MADTAFLGSIGGTAPSEDVSLGLLSRWTFDDNGGDSQYTVYDKYGSRNGTRSSSGGGVYAMWGTNGFYYNTNVTFPDSRAYVTFGNNSAWRWWTNVYWTMTLWARHTNSTWNYNNQEGLVTVSGNISDGNSMLFEFKYTGERFPKCTNVVSSDMRLELNFNSAQWTNSGSANWDICDLRITSITNNSWYMYSVVKIGYDVYVYLNDSLVASNRIYAGSWNPFGGTNSPVLWVGGNYAPGALRGWQGEVQEMRIYTTALSPSQISTVYRRLLP